jgi:ABC-2 type transport system permease protein
MIVAIRKYSWIGWTAIRSNLAYLGEVISRALFLVVILFIFLQLWRVTFSELEATRLGGLTLPQMLWYLALTEAIILSAPRVSHEIDQDVRTGALAIQLIRPLSYPLYRLWTTLGERTVRFLINLGVGVLIVLVLVGPIPLQPMLVLGIPVLALAFVLDFLSYLLIGLAAFWLEETSGIFLIYSRLTMILGGMMMPLELFPDALQAVLRWLPFANIVYGPALMVIAPDLDAFGPLVMRQTIMIMVLSLFAALVYRAALKRIHAHGG